MNQYACQYHNPRNPWGGVSLGGTGEDRWRDVVEAYWRCAVVDRGYFCTGGQTNGEYWTPPSSFLSGWETRPRNTALSTI